MAVLNRRMAAARTRSRRAAIPDTIPAPVEGWDASSPLAAMDPKRAIILENFFPTPEDVRLRRGSASHATGVGTGAVETLMTWEGVSSAKLFAASVSAIYDATSSGAASSAVSSLSNGRWQHLNYNTNAKSYLYAVNGADKPQLYDGTSWVAVDDLSTPAISGITTTKLVNVSAHKRRLWFVEKDSTSAWYLPVDAVGGTATEFDFGPFFQGGGYLVATAAWTLDGGNGPDDYFVAVSSRGDVVVYQGSDPSSADTWSLVGQYRIGSPIGRRCLTKIGGDLVVITVDGLIPIASALTSDRTVAQQKTSISERIYRAMNDAARLYKTNFGWQFIGYPNGTMVLLNVPTTEGVNAEQYVMNTLTGAWCKFTGLNGFAWSLFGDDLYFGGPDGTVFKADTGTDDAGAAIVYGMQTAWNYMGRRGQVKQFTMLAPLLGTDGSVSPAIELMVDYEDRIPTAIPSATEAQGSAWDTSDWDAAEWAGTVAVQRAWTTVAAVGACASVRMRGQAAGVALTVNAFDIAYIPGGIL